MEEEVRQTAATAAGAEKEVTKEYRVKSNRRKLD